MRAVVLALTLALVASHQINLVPEFATGKTFVYKYEGLLLGGLPQQQLAKAGLKVSSKVLISAVSQNTYLLKLMDPQLFEYNGFWPQDSFAPATKLTSALNTELTIPIKFEYVNGAVGKVFAPAGVSATVLNVHRGILNILQLNLKKTQNVYELHEAGTQGVCKTHYMINEDAQTHEIVVKKSKDLTDCHERIMKDIGLSYTETCHECQHRLKSLTRTAAFNYIMKPTETGALISKAEVDEVHQFSAFNTITGAAQMKAKQTLDFLEVQNNKITPASGEYLARGSLQYEFATEILQTPLHLLKIENPQNQIMEVLNHLVENNMKMVHEDAPLKFVQLVQLMRFATYENIEAIWSQCKSKPADRQWVLDTLPAVGTPAALRFIKEKFLANELTMPELTQVLLVALHTVNAEPETIRQTANLVNHPKVRSNPVLREMIMLGYGSMIARHCSEVHSCTSEHLKPAHDLIAEAISQVDIFELTLALKVLGNAGHPASLKPIMKLLPGFGSAAASLPLRVQIDATLALRNIAKKEPKLVQPIALQLFMDKHLHPELRMISCIVLFETKPSAALLSTVANALEKEENQHVVSFTYSHIKSLTKSMAPDFAHVAAAANVAIRMLSPKLERLSNLFSSAQHYDLYISPIMVGAAGTAYMINDAASIMPRAIIMKARAYLAGAAADVLEVGVRTEGLQEALRKLPSGENTDRFTRIQRTIKALMDWKSWQTNQQMASIFVKVLGQEIAFANIDKTFIQQVIIEQAGQMTTGQRAREWLKETVKALQSGIAIQYTKPLLAAEVRRIFPTCVGVPMELSYYTAAVAAAAINVQAKATPALPEHPETVTLDQLKKTNLQLQAEVRPSVAMQTFAVIGVNTDLMQAAVMARGNIHTTLSGKVTVKANLPEGQVKLEYQPITTNDHVAAISFETVAVTRNIQDLNSEKVRSLAPSASSDTQQRQIPSSIQKTLCAVIPYIRTKGCIDVESHNAAFLDSNPLYAIIGQHKAYISAAKDDSSSLQRLEFEIHFGSKAAESLKRESSNINNRNPNESGILMKLREILEDGVKNRTSSSSSSSVSSSVSNSTSSSSSSRSKSVGNSRGSSRSSSSSSSKNVDNRKSSSSRSKNVGNGKSSSSSSRSKNVGNGKSSSSSRSKNVGNSKVSSRSSRSSNSRNSRSSSSRSSSSSSRANGSKSSKNYGPFMKFHKNQHLAPQGTSKTSSLSSIEAYQRKVKLLGDNIPPVFAIIVRTVRSDRTMQYQLAAYVDQPTSRVQIVLQCVEDKWKIYADAVMPSQHKVSAKFALEVKGREYSTVIKAETGLHQQYPAARLELEWERLPEFLNEFASDIRRTTEYIYIIAPLTGIEANRAQNQEREIELILALPAQDRLNIIAKLPRMTLAMQDVPLSIRLPIDKDGNIQPN